jgi:3-oxoacyl-[acyl-carrier-protein] synthase II
MNGQRLSPATGFRAFAHAAACEIARALDLRGPIQTVTSGYIGAMSEARALSRRHNESPEDASRPFDIDRDGNVPGEGAGFLVVERPDLARDRRARRSTTRVSHPRRFRP